jgi:hypothetical protein
MFRAVFDNIFNIIYTKLFKQNDDKILEELIATLEQNPIIYLKANIIFIMICIMNYLMMIIKILENITI